MIDRIGRDGKPIKELYSAKITRLVEQVHNLITRQYSNGNVLDTLESIMKERTQLDGAYECSRDSISRTIFVVHDVSGQAFMSLLIGPYLEYRTTVLATFCRKLSTLIYETGMKDEILEIMFEIILKDMRSRFGEIEGFYFQALDGSKNDGIIKLREGYGVI